MIGQGRPNTWQPAAVGKSPSADGPTTEYRWGISRGNAARLRRQSSREPPREKLRHCQCRRFMPCGSPLLRCRWPSWQRRFSSAPMNLRCGCAWNGAAATGSCGKDRYPCPTVRWPSRLPWESKPTSRVRCGATGRPCTSNRGKRPGLRRRRFRSCGTAKFVFATDSIESRKPGGRGPASASPRRLQDVFAAPLDRTGNRLLIRRVPGDRLRVKLAHDTVIFSAGEVAEIEVEPHLLPTGIGGRVLLVAQLFAARTSRDPLWGNERELNLTADGFATEPAILPVKLPEAEGVYDLRHRYPPPRAAKPIGVEANRRRTKITTDRPGGQTPTAGWCRTAAGRGGNSLRARPGQSPLVEALGQCAADPRYATGPAGKW